MKVWDESMCIFIYYMRYSGCYYKFVVCWGFDGINGFLIGEFELIIFVNLFIRVYVLYIYLGVFFYFVVIMIIERCGFENRV